MVSRKPAEGRIKSGWVKAAHLNASGAQTLPKPMKRFAQCAHPVVDEAHLDSFPRLRNQRVCEGLPSLVFVDDVTFEMNATFGFANGFQPRGIIFTGIFQQPHAVAGNQGCSSRP
jgi:hypothetical protein